MKKAVSTIIFLCLSLNFSQAAEICLNEENLAGVVKTGDTFLIEVSSNPTTGYTYEKSQDYDRRLVRFLQWKYLPSEKQLLGSGGKEIFVFKALRPGKTEIKLAYRRPWEKTEKPLKILLFKVSIQ